MTKVTVKETHPCRRELLIEVPPETMEEELSTVYAGIGRTSRIPGFRPGKAPRKVLEKYYREDARSRTIENRIQKDYLQALEEQDFGVLGDPEISDVNWSVGGPLNFKVAVEISPPVELKEYRGIKLKRKFRPVTESDVDQVIEELRERKAEYSTEPPRPAAVGDWALVDYLPPGREEDKWVEGALIEISGEESRGVGFQLVGLEPGEVREVTLPGSGPDGEKPEDQVFPVRLREIKKRVLPEVDDDWARGWGEYSGVEELRKQIRDDIARTRQLEARRNLESQAAALLLKGSDFPLPPTALENLVASRLNELKRMTAGGGKEAEGTSDEELAAAARQGAEEELKLVFILREIARMEKLEPDPKALGEEIAQLARREGIPPAQVREALEKRGQIPLLRDRLLRRQAMDWVIEQARIKDQEGDN